MEDIANIGSTTLKIKNKLKDIVSGRMPSQAWRLLFESERIYIHSTGGVLKIAVFSSKISVTASDHGPGIPDIEKALTPGFSTAPPWARELGFGSGMGLKNIKRLSSAFNLMSTSSGTVLKFEIATL